MTQLARILGCAREDIVGDEGRGRIEAGANRLASGLFEEAAASDDVVSESAAMEYLELRLAYLGDLVPRETANAVRFRFRELTSRWR